LKVASTLTTSQSSMCSSSLIRLIVMFLLCYVRMGNAPCGDGHYQIVGLDTTHLILSPFFQKCRSLEFSSVYGGGHLISMNIPPRKEEGYNTYSLTMRGILHI
jgi:hypothetical protein